MFVPRFNAVKTSSEKMLTLASPLSWITWNLRKGSRYAYETPNFQSWMFNPETKQEYLVLYEYLIASCYASPTSGEAYRDRRLTTNFELWVEIFCVSTCFHMRIPKPCLSVCPSVCPSVRLSVRLSVRPSVCPHPEKKNPLSFVNISPTLVSDTSMERSSRVLDHGNPKMWKFFRKFGIDEIEFCPYPEFPYAEKRNHLSFVNISPTLVIDTSTKRASRVLQHGNQKIWFFF